MYENVKKLHENFMNVRTDKESKLEKNINQQKNKLLHKNYNER